MEDGGQSKQVGAEKSEFIAVVRMGDGRQERSEWQRKVTSPTTGPEVQATDRPTGLSDI